MKESYILYNLKFTFRDGALYKGTLEYVSEILKEIVKSADKLKIPYHYVIIDSENDRLIEEKQKSIF